MSGSLNKVLLIGNLGNDPEVRSTQDGRSLCTFSIATSESWKDKNSGERRDKTEWHRVVIFNEGLVRIAEQYLKKGSKVYLEGQLQTRKWEDKDGIEKYTTEVVLQNFNGNLTMLGGRSDNSVSDFSWSSRIVSPLTKSRSIIFATNLSSFTGITFRASPVS